MFLGKMHLISDKTCHLYMKFAFYFSLYRLALHLLILHLLIIVLHLLKDCLIRKENSAHFSYHNLVYDFWCLKYHMTWMNACPRFVQCEDISACFQLTVTGETANIYSHDNMTTVVSCFPCKVKSRQKKSS